MSHIRIGQNSKLGLLFTNFTFVEDYGIVTEVFIFEPAKGRFNLVDVSLLFKHAENEREDGELGID